ncbi:MAG: hypothetical protein ACTHMP_12695, partial [Thermomicrobiales bacterium]
HSSTRWRHARTTESELVQRAQPIGAAGGSRKASPSEAARADEVASRCLTASFACRQTAL